MPRVWWVRFDRAGALPAAERLPANVTGPVRLFNWNRSVNFTAAKLVYPETIADVQAVRLLRSLCRACVGFAWSWPSHARYGTSKSVMVQVPGLQAARLLHLPCVTLLLHHVHPLSTRTHAEASWLRCLALQRLRHTCAYTMQC